MPLDYFYGQVGELFSFYRIPKALFLESRFQNLSTDAKTLYGILLDRMSLSAKNGWLDEQGRVFIIFTIEDVKRALCCADNKATKLLRELEEFGLIERKRRGLGRPSLVYVKNFSAESSKSIFQNRDFHDSGGFKSASQDPAKSRCNKTEENSTEKSETYPFYSEEDDGMSKHEQLEEYFSQSLELDILLRLCPDDEDTIYQIVDPVVDALLNQYLRSAKENQIQVLLDITIPEVLAISTLLLSVVIGNTFDNAIEACRLIAPEKRVIHLQLRKQNRILFYSIENPYIDAVTQLRVGKHHGYGLKNVERAVNQNNGNFQVEKVDGNFIVQIRLNCEN